jgi:hypothetical protein
MEAVMAGWKHVAAIPLPPTHSRKYPRGGKAGKTRWFQMDNKSAHGREREKGFSKVNDQCGNVYENKGSAFHRRGPSGNVVENTRSYTLKAGMFQKTGMLALSAECFLLSFRGNASVSGA